MSYLVSPLCLPKAHLRLLQQHLAEADAHLPAAGERGHGERVVRGGEAHRLEHAVDLAWP